MEDDKPTYEQIEKELNEYKELLWQLSDEYKVNLGAAEKKVEEEKDKFKKLEQQISGGIQQVVVSKTEEELAEIQPSASYLYSLGLPACVLDNTGKIVDQNNKFKFLIELIGFEIEEVENISALFKKNKLEGLQERFNKYTESDDGVLQSLLKLENQFQAIVNLVVRVYRNADNNQHLALFVELSANEIKNICDEKLVISEKTEVKNSDEIAEMRIEIAVFTEKYELFEEISKSIEFSEDKNEITSSILQSIKKSFNLDIIRNKILEKLHTAFKSFVFYINQKFPELTNNEEKHCMLIKAGLTYKEIAALMGVSINGVKIARNRLRKKFDLENETKTSDFIDNIF